jgi:hypothetical protein
LKPDDKDRKQLELSEKGKQCGSAAPRKAGMYLELLHEIVERILAAT